MRFSLKEVLKPSMKERFESLDGLVRLRSAISLARALVRAPLCLRLLLSLALACSSAEGLGDLFFASLSLFEMRTDLEVFVLPKVDGFDLKSLVLWTAEG